VPATRVSGLAIETTLACRGKNCNSAQEDTELPVPMEEAREATRLYQEITTQIGQTDQLSEYTA